MSDKFVTDDGDVRLYWFAMEAAEADLPVLRAGLSPAERARADRFLDAAHGHRFAVAHAGLRALLGREQGVAPSEVAFAFGVNGKPFLADSPLQFNLSHSGGYALVAVSWGGELGVDIEYQRTNLDVLGLARRFFTVNETRWLKALPEAERRRGFCRLWTCKEAWLKSNGQGLALPLDRMEITFGPEGPRLQATVPPARSWFAQEFELLPGYCAALVQDAAPARVSVTRLAAPEFVPVPDGG